VLPFIVLPVIEAKLYYALNAPEFNDIGYYNYDSNSNGELLVIKELIKDGDVVFDVGANVGNWTEQAIGQHKNLNVFAFEPIPTLVDSMTKKFEEKKVTVKKLAMFSSEKKLDFEYYENHSDASGIYHQNWVTQECGAPKKITVDTTYLDKFCKDNKINHINFLKIDTEGSELDVLKGGSELLKDHSIDVIQFEYTCTYPDAGITLKQIYEYLTKFGYKIFRECGDGLIYISNWDDSLECYRYSNYVALHDMGLVTIIS
jgi:FkbM family methyltransferase